MANQSKHSSDLGIFGKRLLGLFVLLILGALLYPLVFDDIKPSYKVNKNSLIPPPPDHIAIMPHPNKAADSAGGSEATDTASKSEGDAADTALMGGGEAADTASKDGQQAADTASKSGVTEVDTAAEVTAEPTLEAISSRDVLGDDKWQLPPAWLIQVASFGDKKRAETMQQILQDKGLKAYTETADLSDRTNFRVYVGPYIDRAETERDQTVIAELTATRPQIIRYIIH